MPQLKDQKPYGLGIVRGNRGKPRKAKFTSLSLDDFIAWVCDGKCRRVTGVPQGSKVVGAQYDLVTNSLILAIEHESFPGQAPGQPVNYFELIFQECSETHTEAD